jgi:hypothetical protein
MHTRKQPFSAKLFESPAITWTTGTLTVEDESSAQRISPLTEIDSKPFHSRTRVLDIKISDVVYLGSRSVSVYGSGNRLRGDPILVRERYKPSFQFLECYARISSLQWVRWDSRIRTLKELLASATSEKD